MKTLDIEAKIDNLDSVVSFINNELENSGCGMKATMQIDVAVEELFVNIASYAYVPGTGDVRISINIEDNPAAAVISFTDSGIPYNPLTKEDPDTGLSAEEREIGGLGIFMVKQSMDLMQYEYTNGQNIVTITKYL